MNLNEIKDLMAQFDQSSLREFSYKNGTDELQFSKNEARMASEVPAQVVPAPAAVTPSPVVSAPSTPVESAVEEAPAPAETTVAPEGDVVESPLVGVAYLAAGPDKPAFVTVGDSVKKGQTLVIIEAMKVMNEIPAPKDGVVTEILVSPHRYPMLLVDRVLEVSEDTIVALKNVTINEPFFNGHFPQYPVMPGVLIMEALAQTAGVLELSKPENKGKLVFYAGMDKVKFKKQVVPGDQLVMTATFVKRRGTIAVVEAKAEVDGKLAASGTLTFAIGN